MAKRASMGHGDHGEVCSVNQDYSDPDRVRVTLRHGKKKPAKKNKAGAFSMGVGGDDRPTSEISVPKSKAHHYPVGKKVRVAVHPARPRTKKADTRDEDFDAMFGGKGV